MVHELRRINFSETVQKYLAFILPLFKMPRIIHLSILHNLRFHKAFCSLSMRFFNILKHSEDLRSTNHNLSKQIVCSSALHFVVCSISACYRSASSVREVLCLWK